MEKLALLEAMLFTTNEPLSIEEMQKILKIRKDSIEKMIKELKEKYEKNEHGIYLSDTRGYKLNVKNEYLTQVSHLTPHADLSRGLLRVLSIIAYHEPIKQADIVKVVGNRTYEYTKELEERGLVVSEKKHRTKILKTTPHFESYFGARSSQIKKVLKNIEDKLHGSGHNEVPDKPGDPAPAG